MTCNDGNCPEKPTYRTDPSQNYIERYPQPLDALFLPETVALIGAKDDPGSVGATLFHNLRSGGFPGTVYPINPKRTTVGGVPCFPSVGALPRQVDLAVIVTPAATVPALMAECAAAHVRAVIVISAGFKERGVEGVRLEQQVIAAARGIPVIGPNCLGVMNPVYGLNATFARGMALPGHLAFISQSGAMCTSVLDWSFREKIGFSAFVSIGSMADVDWGALIDYLGRDPHTHSLLLYMETVGDARSFLTAAREVALEKPIIVIKPGRSQAAAQAAASHTGSLAGSDEVFDAALERVGVLRVNTIAELFSMASVLGRQPRPTGGGLAIVTNAGGPAVLATDAVVQNGAALAPLAPSTVEALNQFLPAAWSHSNPIDILGDATADTYAKTVDIVAKDPHTDGILVVLSPQDMTDPTAVAKKMVPYAHLNTKPILASWMGGKTVEEGTRILTHAAIPVFEYPDAAAQTFAAMWRYSQNIKNLYEMETITSEHSIRHREASAIISAIVQTGRTLLSEAESKQLLSCYDIPVVETVVAATEQEAVSVALSMGFPVVLKLLSETITHKSDVGGVKLNLSTAAEVAQAFASIQANVPASDFQGVTVQRMVERKGYELILGSSTDPQFGPVILFGSGGQLVEIFKDSALALPPLTAVLARQLMKKTKIYEALKGVRGEKPVDLQVLEHLLIRFSRLIVDHPRIKECDINPLAVSNREIVALDARVVLHGQELSDAQLPRPAIRPYPLDHVSAITLKNGLSVMLRPIRPEDESLIIKFHQELSEHSIRQRFFEFMSLDERIAHERLIRICFPDYDREWTLVAEISHQRIILETAVQDGKVMQDFELESFFTGGEHSQMVKAPLVKTDCGSKDCVNFPSSTAVSRIIGVGRLSRIPGTGGVRLTMIIVDEFHHLGLGSQLLAKLLEIAKREEVEWIDARILAENQGMIAICRRLGFAITQDKDPDILRAVYEYKRDRDRDRSHTS